MTIFTRLRQLLRQYRNIYIWFNVAYYGLIVGGMIGVAHAPDLAQTLRTSIRGIFNQTLTQAYDQGLFLQAAYLTFVNNFFLASVLAMTVPSLLIPFWGLGIGATRALLWGLALSPADPSYGLKLSPPGSPVTHIPQKHTLNRNFS